MGSRIKEDLSSKSIDEILARMYSVSLTLFTLFIRSLNGEKDLQKEAARREQEIEALVKLKESQLDQRMSERERDKFGLQEKQKKELESLGGYTAPTRVERKDCLISNSQGRNLLYASRRILMGLFIWEMRGLPFSAMNTQKNIIVKSLNMN